VIVDAATGLSPEQQPATEFFVTAAHHLQEAGVRAGVRRPVVVSIINIDKLAGGYGLAKVAHEDAWRSGPIPVRIVRAAQFHEFVAQLLKWGTQGDVAYVPEMRTRIVSARTVAEVVADAATSADDPAGIVEIAGPREEDRAQLATMLVVRRGTPVKVQAVRNPADPDADMQATDGLLPGPARGPGWPARRSRSGSTGSSAHRPAPAGRIEHATEPALARRGRRAAAHGALAPGPGLPDDLQRRAGRWPRPARVGAQRSGPGGLLAHRPGRTPS
jgi:uncharacterized protein YbjT (DUF2867 family)